MIDDQDFSLATPIFETVLRALSAIEPTGRRRVLEQHGAMGARAQDFDLLVRSHARRSLRIDGKVGVASSFSSPKTLSADREAAALQGRAKRAGAQRRTLVGADGASGSHVFLSLCSGFPFLFHSYANAKRMEARRLAWL
ncbi:hypothetical protein [Methylosinus sp. RM1]|uniref:hypothetical protein n=1 Tax=Methylosinus sp. RM1 TaxID=2583817 RepID=UPI001407CC81|nr:hypothetical protein [Methylosinus sp. RM1]